MAISKKNITPLICLSVMVLDIVAGVLGIEAELAQNKVKKVRLWIFECRDPSHEAFRMGVAAAVLLAVAHAVANLLGGCTCIWSKQELDKATPNHQLAAASLALSWIVLAVGFSMLIIGALANSKSKAYCGISHHRFLSIGGILCFIHGLFSIAYYVSAAATAREKELVGPPPPA
ncbi:protein DESIGUAL 2 [Malania oleifera]|uniref:protein DESIGUAL 2 n=1 Tax=Malania oleifera TaxID=397392 RepID=UPI0025AE83FD|nr:protein DESIGUAL 2 [Malania oleifera]